MTLMTIQKILLWLVCCMLFGFTMIHAQDGSCEQAAQQALALIESAQQSLNDGNYNTASGQLEDARTRLQDCTVDVSDETVAEPTTEPTTEAASSEPTVPPQPTDIVEEPQSQPTGDFTVNPPDINSEQGVTFVRFAHTSIDSGALDIYRSNNMNTPIVANLQYGEATGFVPMNIGSLTFVAHSAGTDDKLYRVNWDFVGNSSWILTAAGLTETFAFIVEPVSVIRNQYNGQARVRVVNLLAGVVRASVDDAENGINFGDGLGWVGIKDTLVAPGQL